MRISLNWKPKLCLHQLDMGQKLGKEIDKAYSHWSKIEREVEAEIERQKLHFRPGSIDELVQETHFTRKEIQLLYRSFKENCPSGIVTLEKFLEIYSQFFYYGHPDTYATLVFKTFDTDRSGSISFEEFVKGLSTLWKGTAREKLAWVFDLYDSTNKGYITKSDLLSVMTAIYDMMGDNSYPPFTSNDVIHHVQDIFSQMDVNDDGKISLEEFLELCTKNQAVCQSLKLFDTIWVK